MTRSLCHSGWYLAGAGGTVVVYKGGAIVINLTVEQTASQREIEHLPLTWRKVMQRKMVIKKQN